MTTTHKNNHVQQDNELAENDSLLKAPSKRKFLQGLSAMLGTAAAAQLLSPVTLAKAFEYHQNGESGTALQFFSIEQKKTLHHVCDTVLPETDTPSATQLDVHGFVEHQLIHCGSKVQQQQVKLILDKIEVQSQKAHKQPFVALSAQQKQLLLTELEQTKLSFTEVDKTRFRALKSLLVFGYFTTEVGATVALAYQAVPGGFKGSIPYQSIGKTYGSLAYY